MRKREFIQMASLFYHVKPDRNRTVIQFGEWMWGQLEAKGYGSPKSRGANAHVKNYERLEGQSKEFFDRFMAAFKDNRGKDNAAGAWIKRGEMSKAEMGHLVYAGSVYAAGRALLVQQQQGVIMAQGYINQRRDADVPKVRDQHNEAMRAKLTEQVRTIQADMVHYQRLYDDTGDKVHYDEVERLKKKLKTTRGLL